MDRNNLIDFSSPAENGSKLVLPLIQMSDESGETYSARLSDVDSNNPFDKALRNITNGPFERAISSNIANCQNDDKENCTRLISPLQTPKRMRKKKCFTKNPLFLDTSITPQKHLDVSLNIMQNSANLSNVSMEYLSESFLNDFEESFSAALILPLPDTSNEELDESVNKPKMFRNLSQRLKASLKMIPSINICDENSQSDSALHQTFLDSKNIESSRIKSSVDNLKNTLSFNMGSSTISSINPSFTSSQDIRDFDCAFLENKNPESSENLYSFNTRKCQTAQKSSKAELSQQYLTCLPDKPQLKAINNSFSGFNLNDRNSPHNVLEDSVYLEAQNLANVFHNLANNTHELEDELSVCTPPWMTDDVILCDDDEEKEIIIEVSKQNEITLPEPENCQEMSSDSGSKSSSSSLLNILRDIMKNDGNEVDERKLEENLLSSLAKAFHFNTAGSNVEEPQAKSSENTLPEFNITEAPTFENQVIQSENNNVKVVPKLKTQSTAPIKNLKVKNVTTTAKGPLKAMIPLTNMAKNKRSSTSKVVCNNITPSKNALSVYQIKRASTPNEPKLQPPIAQSTPDVSKVGQQVPNSGTPVKNRSFLYSLSPLSRRSTSDLSGEINLNKSLSPNNISDSVPNNLNKSGASLVKHGSTSSIPTMKSNTSLYRRNSVGEKPDSSVLNRSYENKKASRPSLLKRSSSFQSKTSKSVPENNNEHKRSGGFGMIKKSLSLVKK